MGCAIGLVFGLRNSPTLRNWLIADGVSQGSSQSGDIELAGADTFKKNSDPLAIHVSVSMQKASGARFGKVEKKVWNDDRIIPAKLELDPARHYAVSAPADVIVEELSCPLGHAVRRGEPLLEMSSSQLTNLRGGLARQHLLTQKAKRSVQWHRDIEKRVDEIIAKIEATAETPSRDWMPPPSVQTAEYGAKILSAFAKYWAATQMSQISERAINSGVMAEKSMIERTTDREGARAVLRGAIEQSRFDLQQEILAAESDLAAAEGSLQSIQSDMRRYLGLKSWDEDLASKPMNAEMPDRFIHYSPGDGTVLERYFANGERASVGELIVLVADVTSLWCIGDLRQRDWDLLQLKRGDAIEAEIVGLESLGHIPAKIEMVGGTVQSATGSIRLTASIANNELRMRPGMIARLILPQPKEGIVLPVGAVFSNDGKDYLIRKEAAEAFRLVRIQLGKRQQSTVEILEGAQMGWEVLVEGVFQIASQAFLEKE